MRNRTIAILVLLGFTPFALAQQLKERLMLKAHSERVEAIAISPAGKVVGTAGACLGSAPKDKEFEIKLWDLASGKERHSFAAPERETRDLVFSPDGKRFAAAFGDDSVRVWEIYDRRRVALIEKTFTGPMLLAFKPDGWQLVVVGYNQAWTCDWRTGDVLSSWQEGKHSYYGVALSPDLKMAAVPAHQDVDLLDVATGKEKGVLLDHRGRTQGAVFSTDGKLLAVVSTYQEGRNPARSEVKVWDVSKGKEVTTLRGFNNSLHSLGLSPDGKRLCMVHIPDGELRTDLCLLDVATGKTLSKLGYPFKYRSGWRVRFTPDGKSLVGACEDGKVRIWDVMDSRKDGDRQGK